MSRNEGALRAVVQSLRDSHRWKAWEPALWLLALADTQGSKARLP